MLLSLRWTLAFSLFSSAACLWYAGQLQGGAHSLLSGLLHSSKVCGQKTGQMNQMFTHSFRL